MFTLNSHYCFPMKFTFKNFGIVQYAEIELNGLTVLTGLNDSGKSFIGKGIFAIIKTINNSEEAYKINKSNIVGQFVVNIYSGHRQMVPFTNERNQKFEINGIVGKIRQGILSNDPSVLQYLTDYKNSVLEDIASAGITLQNDNYSRNRHLIENSFLNAIKIINENKSIEEKYKEYFNNNMVFNLFQSQVNTLGTDTQCEIELFEGVTKLIRIIIQNNNTTSFEVLSPLLQKDCTIIETPTIIQLDKVMNAVPYHISSNYGAPPIHFMDLINKLTSPTIIFEDKGLLEIYSEINKLIKGNISFKAADRSFLFEKNSNQIRSFNIATGIKSLGLIQLLFYSGKINNNSILIIDEPEVHLHPEWEIEYSRILVLLSKAGIPILLSTHSPYFIKALSVYSKKEKIEDKINVYYGKAEPNGTTIFGKITDNLTPFLDTLAHPMQKLFLEN